MTCFSIKGITSLHRDRLLKLEWNFNTAQNEWTIETKSRLDKKITEVEDLEGTIISEKSSKNKT